MKLLILCAVLSVCVVVSLANPVKTQIHDEADSSSASAESIEQKISKINLSSSSSSSSSEEVKKDINVAKFKIKHNNVEDNSSDTSEEQSETNAILKDVISENLSAEEEELYDNNIITRAKRAVIFTPHVNNQLSVKDEGTIKYEKYLKLKLLRRAFESDSKYNYYRKGRNAETSEENSSEEHKQDKNQVKDVVTTKKPETEHSKVLELEPKPEAAGSESKAEVSRRKRQCSCSDTSENQLSEEVRKKNSAKMKLDPSRVIYSTPVNLKRKRSLEALNEEYQSEQERDVNEVFIFSQEKERDSAENFNNNNLKTNAYAVVSEKNEQSLEISRENKNSEEDYAQGCGGNRDDNSNESSNENNETLNENL